MGSSIEGAGWMAAFSFACAAAAGLCEDLASMPATAAALSIASGVSLIAAIGIVAWKVG